MAATVATKWPVFETDSGSTPQEFAGWGGGLYVEPALKIASSYGNRDLVLLPGRGAGVARDRRQPDQRTPGEIAEAKRWVAEYKVIRETVQQGSLCGS